FGYRMIFVTASVGTSKAYSMDNRSLDRALAVLATLAGVTDGDRHPPDPQHAGFLPERPFSRRLSRFPRRAACRDGTEDQSRPRQSLHGFLRRLLCPAGRSPARAAGRAPDRRRAGGGDADALPRLV